MQGVGEQHLGCGWVPPGYQFGDLRQRLGLDTEVSYGAGRAFGGGEILPHERLCFFPGSTATCDLERPPAAASSPSSTPSSSRLRPSSG